MGQEFTTFHPAKLPLKAMHQLLIGSVNPRPIAWASTVNKAGEHNLAPFSFFNVFSAQPPMLAFSPARRGRDNTTKHTLENLYEVPEVVVNVVSFALLEQMNITSAEYPEGVNEFEKAGLTSLTSEKVRPLRIAESPVQMECIVREIKPLSQQGGGGQLILAEIVAFHITPEVLDEKGRPNPFKLDLVGRLGKNYYTRVQGDAIMAVEGPVAGLILGIDQLPAYIRNSTILTGNDLGKLTNITELPSQAAVADFWKQHSEDLSKLTDTGQLHQKAQVLLKNGRKEEALFTLLCQPFLFQR